MESFSVNDTNSFWTATVSVTRSALAKAIAASTRKDMVVQHQLGLTSTHICSGLPGSHVTYCLLTHGTAIACVHGSRCFWTQKAPHLMSKLPSHPPPLCHWLAWCQACSSTTREECLMRTVWRVCSQQLTSWRSCSRLTVSHHDSGGTLCCVVWVGTKPQVCGHHRLVAFRCSVQVAP